MCYYNGFKIPAPQADEISYKNLKPDIELMSKIFSGCGDFEKRKINIGLEGNIFITVCWLDGIVSGGDVGDNVLRPLGLSKKAATAPDEKSCIELIMEGSVYSYSVKKRDKVTDVISFAFDESNAISNSPVVGEMYICYQKAIDQAKEYGHSLKRELCFLFCHGLLHLYGYDHMEEAQAEQMFKLQDIILDKCKIYRERT